MESTFMVRSFPPFHGKGGKRLVKSPRLFLRDSGLLHALLGLRTLDDLDGHPAVGASWEGFVLEQLLVHLTPRWQTSFYRTAAGSELDLVAESRIRRIGFEIKYSSAPSVTRGFWSAIKDLDLERAFVLAPVAQAYPLADNVEVIPVSVQGFRTISEVLDPKPA